MVSPAQQRWAQDRAAYRRDPWMRTPTWWLTEPTAWALRVHRWGEGVRDLPGPRGLALRRLHWYVSVAVRCATGVEILPGATIGGGLRIWHGHGLVINPNAVIGERCVLRQGVTIGNLTPGGPAPVIGDDVEVGAYAQILGGVTVGAGARIGAMSVVLKDVPPGATAVGIPARIVNRAAAPLTPATRGDRSA